jgi:hypothetical protein
MKDDVQRLNNNVCRNCFRFKRFDWTEDKGLCGSLVVASCSESCKHFENKVNEETNSLHIG